MIAIEFFAPPGLTLSASLFAINSDVVVEDSTSVTEQPTKGAYVADFSALLVGAYLVVAYDNSSSPPVAIVTSYVYVAAATGTYRTGNYADVVSAQSIDLLRAISKNKTVTDPVSGTMIVFAEDDSTPLLVAPLYEDVAETQLYRGRGAEVRGRLE